MKRLLITGATGGLGRNAVTAMLKKGVEVRATGRHPDTGKLLSAQGAEFVALDLAATTAAELARLVSGVDAVWHCAALSSPWGAPADFMAANVTATSHLLKTAGEAGVQRFVHVSTPAIYFDYSHRLEVKEGFRPASYVNAYARTKAAAEQCVQDAVMAFRTMHCTILRPRAMFGPHDQVVMPRLTRVMDARGGRLPLPRGGQVTLDLTYVDNVVHALSLAACSQRVPSGSAFNITNHEPAVLRDVLKMLFVDRLQRPLHILPLPYPLMAMVARGMDAVARVTHKEPAMTPYSLGALSFDMTLDNSRARQLLGYSPVVSLSEGISRTAEWMNQHG